MSANSKNSSQTNATQAQLASQQSTIQSQIIAAESANNALINADLGKHFGVPHPFAMPSVSAVIGPSESAILARLTPGAIAMAETQAQAGVDPNETGILATFANSAHSAQENLKASTLALSSSYGEQSASAEALIASSAAASQSDLARAAGGNALPLGPQYTSVPAYSVNDFGPIAAPAASGPSPILLVLLVGGGVGGLYLMRKHL